MLEDKLQEDFKQALKAKNPAPLVALRMLKAAMENYAIDKRKKKLEDGEIIELISKQIKRHQESIESFKKGGREDLVKKEEEEMRILQAYMPKTLSEVELNEIIKNIISELCVTSRQDMGKIMKEVMSKVKGRADGKTVSGLVSKALESFG